MDTNCLLKCVFAGVGGYGIGLTFGLFFNAMEFRDVETHKGFRTTTREALRVDIKKIKSTAKGMAIFGVCFTFFECLVEKTRLRNDIISSFNGGGLTSAFLAMDTGLKTRGLITTYITGGLFMAIFDKLQIFGGH